MLKYETEKKGGNLNVKKWLTLFIILCSLIITGCETDKIPAKTNEETDVNKTEVQESNTDEPVNNTIISTKEKNQAEENTNKISNSESEMKQDDVYENLSVHFIDVGQADATLFEYTSNEEDYNVLFDTGNWNRNDVKAYLNSQGIDSLDVIIGSHPHADHIGQMELLLEDIDIDEVWMSGDTTTSQTFARVLNAIESSDVEYDEPRAGDVFDMGPLTIEFFNPDRLSDDLHEGSLSAKFSYGEVSFLLTGDAETQTEQAMIDRGYDLQADVLQLGHHGSDTSTTSAFLAEVSPTKAVISAGENNSYGHPHESVIERVLEADVTLYNTIQHGTIIMRTDGQEIEVYTENGSSISPTVSGSQKDSELSHSKPVISSDDVPETDDCIDINEAPVIELEDIIHIGQARAKELITLRSFSSIEEMDKISGIAAGRLSDIISEGKACVGG